jgi:hypothetical protein
VVTLARRSAFAVGAVTLLARVLFGGPASAQRFVLPHRCRDDQPSRTDCSRPRAGRGHVRLAVRRSPSGAVPRLPMKGPTGETRPPGVDIRVFCAISDWKCPRTKRWGVARKMSQQKITDGLLS